jgi:hypothetical protein
MSTAVLTQSEARSQVPATSSARQRKASSQLKTVSPPRENVVLTQPLSFAAAYCQRVKRERAQLRTWLTANSFCALVCFAAVAAMFFWFIVPKL